MLGIASYYVFYGKFHEVAFRRVWRALEPLERDCRQLNAKVTALMHVFPRQKRKIKKQRGRKLRVICFIAASTIGTIVIVAFAYAFNLMRILFSAVIIWKGFDRFGLKADELYARLRLIRDTLINKLWSPWLAYMIQPFIKLLDIVAKFDLDLGAVEVTCKGIKKLIFISYLFMCIDLHHNFDFNS